MAKEPTKKDLQEELRGTKKELTTSKESKENIRQKFVEKEKALIEGTDKLELRIIFYALGLMLVSTGFLYFLAFSQTAFLILIICIIILGIFVGSIWIVAGVNNNFTDLFNLGFKIFYYSAVFTLIIGFAGSSYYCLNSWLIYFVYFILIVFTLCFVVGGSFNEVKNKCSFIIAGCLCLIPLLILLLGIVPLSKYHNLNQIEHDKRIAEILQITNEPNGIKILLPAEYASEEKYTKQVLCFAWPDQNDDWTFASPWEQISLQCCRGKIKWYEANLNFPAIAKEDQKLIYDKKKEVILFFNHAWQDHSIRKEIP